MKRISLFPIIRPVILAVIALTLSYYFTNINVSITGEKTVLKYWSSFFNWLTFGRETKIDDNTVFINVANDKQLVEVSDEFGIPIGNAAVTDRQKICKFLDLIAEAGSYQYVMLDVFFELGFKTPADSSLFSLISTMDRIVIPKHADGELGNDALEDKAGYADYATSINENDFTKYLLFRKDGVSFPLKAYSETTGRKVKRTFLWYSEEGRLSRRVVFPKMYAHIDGPYRSDGQKAYLNLGADILDTESDVDWADFFRGKLIVIGSFSGDDIHTTYAGDLPGSVINYNVFLSLMKGHHKIPVGLIIVYFCIFFAMAFLVLNGGANAPHSWAWLWTKLFAFYSLILTIVCIFVFVIWGQAHDIFITSTFFSIVDLLNRRVKTKKKTNA